MKELFQHTAITPLGEAGRSNGQVGVDAKAAGIVVRVAVNFLPEQSHIAAGRWFWAYHIRIENHTDQVVQLLNRHWKITDGRGAVNHVDGPGVVGEQPVLHPGRSHDYVSGCPLNTPTGSMEGHYEFHCEDGRTVKAAIPYFPLTAPATATRPAG